MRPPSCARSRRLMSRRWLRAGATSALAIARRSRAPEPARGGLPGCQGAIASAPTPAGAPMKYRQLGASPLRVSEIALGSWLTFAGGLERENAEAVVRAALDSGI